MRRLHIVIAVVLCAVGLTVLILVANGQQPGVPFPPPPIIPPKESGVPAVLPDFAPKQIPKNTAPNPLPIQLIKKKVIPTGAPVIVPAAFPSGDDKTQRIPIKTKNDLLRKKNPALPGPPDPVSIPQKIAPKPVPPAKPKPRDNDSPPIGMELPSLQKPAPSTPHKTKKPDLGLLPNFPETDKSPMPPPLPDFPTPAKQPSVSGPTEKKKQTPKSVPLPIMPTVEQPMEIAPKPQAPVPDELLPKKPKTTKWPTETIPTLKKPARKAAAMQKPAKPAFKILTPLQARIPIRQAWPSSQKNVPAKLSVRQQKTGVKTPVLAVEKSGPKTVLLGQPFQYEITVRNLSKQPAFRVIVEDELPYGVRVLSAQPKAVADGKKLGWITDIPVGGIRIFRVHVQSTAAGEWTNTANISVSANQSFTTTVQATSLNVRINGPMSVDVEKEVEFTIHVTNNGKSAHSNVILYADLSPGLQHPSGSKVEGKIGDLAAGAENIVKLKAKTIQYGPQWLRVRVQADSGHRAQSKAAVKVGKTGLSVKIHAPKQLQLNRDGQLIVDVANLRSVPVNNVVVQSRLPDGLEFLSASDKGLYRKNTRTVHWLVPEMSPGEVQRLALRVRADAPGEHIPIVVAHTDSGKSTRQMQKVHIGDESNLSVKIHQSDHTVKIGKKTLYQIHVENLGQVPATNVQIRIPLPKGLSLWQSTGPTRAAYRNRTVVYQPIARIDPGKRVIFGLVLIPRTIGEHRFDVQISSDRHPR